MIKAGHIRFSHDAVVGSYGVLLLDYVVSICERSQCVNSHKMPSGVGDYALRYLNVDKLIGNLLCLKTKNPSVSRGVSVLIKRFKLLRYVPTEGFSSLLMAVILRYCQGYVER